MTQSRIMSSSFSMLLSWFRELLYLSYTSDKDPASFLHPHVSSHIQSRNRPETVLAQHH